MKKLSQLIKEFIQALVETTPTHTTSVHAKKEAQLLEKAWFTYQKDKEADIQESHKQRELLYQFMHFHKDHNLN